VRFPVGLLSLRLLTICFLSQAPLLGGLHRASRVPFRGSYFTSGLHPPDATPQRLIACLYRPWGFPPITSLRFVAHQYSLTITASVTWASWVYGSPAPLARVPTKLDLMPAPKGYPGSFGWVRTEPPYRL
jgi:hypothetical protein